MVWMDGSYIISRNMQYVSQVTTRELGSDKFDFHSLRHTNATILAEKGAAAKQFYKDFGDILHRLADNPYQFPPEEDLNLPDGQYHKAIFAKWYKALFMIENQTVYLDAVVDGRMDGKR